MSELAVTAIGRDRPGIVAAVTEALRDAGGNLEDSAMTILGGQFAIMLLVDVGGGAEALRRALDDVADDLRLTISVTEVEGERSGLTPTHVLSVYGTDQPGLLAGVSRRLADLGINITDLSTRVLPPDDQPIYAMVFELVVPADLDAVEVDAALADVGSSLGVDHTLRPLEPETY